MAQQSARRGWKNQVYSSCLEHAFMIWSPVCELPYGPRSFIAAPSEAGQMAASDYVPNFSKNRLHLAGRPQMSTRPDSISDVSDGPIRRGHKFLQAIQGKWTCRPRSRIHNRGIHAAPRNSTNRKREQKKSKKSFALVLSS